MLISFFRSSHNEAPKNRHSKRRHFRRHPSHTLGLEQLEDRRVLATLGQIGGAGDDLVSSQVMDVAGNVYLAGRFNQAADFDAGVGTMTLTPVGIGNDHFVAKYRPDGSLAWAKQFGGSSGTADLTGGLTVDSAGNTYVPGVLTGTADFGNGIFLSATGDSFDAFIMKLDSSGSTVWARAVGGTGVDNALGVAVDGVSVYVSGGFSGQVDFDRSMTYPDNRDILKAAGKGANTQRDAFVWRLNTDNGTFVSAWRIGSTGTDDGTSIVAANGVVYLHGRFQGTVDFDPRPTATANRTSTSSQDLFVARYTPDAVGGLPLNWVQTIGGSNAISPSSKMVADANSLYLPGSFWGTIDFDRNNSNAGDTLTSVARSGDVFVAKFNTANGSLAWVRGVGGSGEEMGGSSLAVTDTGMVYIGGVFSQTVDFAPGLAYSGNRDVLTSKGLGDGFNLQLDMNGTYVNAWRMGGIMGDSSRVIGVYEGRLYSAGWFEQTADFPTVGSLTSQGASRDIFLMSLDLPTVSPLLAAATGPGAPTANQLTNTDLEPIVAEAKARWSALGADPTQLAGAQVALANLSGEYLGLASGNTIYLDNNAAGWGWFVDPTPGDDSEFLRPGNQGEMNRIDLLSVVMHELGHLLGHNHEEDGLMAETLATGVRSTLAEAEHDAVLAQLDGQMAAWLPDSVESGDVRARRRR